MGKNLHGKRVFTVTPDSVTVHPVPGGGFKYRIDGHSSYSKYATEDSAKYDSLRLQVEHDNGVIEPLESAEKFNRL